MSKKYELWNEDAWIKTKMELHFNNQVFVHSGKRNYLHFPIKTVKFWGKNLMTSENLKKKLVKIDANVDVFQFDATPCYRFYV